MADAAFPEVSAHIKAKADAIEEAKTRPRLYNTLPYDLILRGGPQERDIERVIRRDPEFTIDPPPEQCSGFGMMLLNQQGESMEEIAFTLAETLNVDSDHRDKIKAMDREGCVILALPALAQFLKKEGLVKHATLITHHSNPRETVRNSDGYVVGMRSLWLIYDPKLPAKFQ